VSDWKDLAPEICRQRIVIEGTLHNPFKAEDMDRYCRAFDPKTPVRYTEEFFGDDLIEITWKE
jgi:hypothetical protein